MHLRLVVFCVLACAAAQVEAAPVIVTDAPRGFTVVPPKGWTRQPSDGDERLAVTSPEGKPEMICNVTMTESAMLRNLTQEDLNRSVMKARDLAEFERQYGAIYNDVHIVSATPFMISGYPARNVSMTATVVTQGVTVYIKMAVFTTLLAPGISTGILCAGAGTTADEAAKAYEYWKLDGIAFAQSFKYLAAKGATSKTSAASK